MPRAVITGAFSYTGAAVARELVGRGWHVHTLTNRRPPPGSEAITHAPLRFDPEALARALEGADTFVNTFWVRLPYGGETFATAVTKSRVLIEAAKRAGVRFVHLSVSNAAAGRNLGYYRGKADLEDAIRASGLDFAIVRPTLVVGPADVLTSNIAWFLRRFPVFPMPGGGGYRVQPVTLDDVGRIVANAVDAQGNLEIDAAGPEVFTFSDYVRLLGQACGARRPLLSVPGGVALACLRLVEWVLRDVILTREELLGLEQELLLSHEPPRGTDSVRAWLMQHAPTMGTRYVNDLARHFTTGASEPVLHPLTLTAVERVSSDAPR